MKYIHTELSSLVPLTNSPIEIRCNFQKSWRFGTCIHTQAWLSTECKIIKYHGIFKNNMPNLLYLSWAYIKKNVVLKIILVFVGNLTKCISCDVGNSVLPVCDYRMNNFTYFNTQNKYFKLLGRWDTRLKKPLWVCECFMVQSRISL